MMYGENNGSGEVLRYIKKGTIGAEIGVWKGSTSRHFVKKNLKELHLVDPYTLPSDKKQKKEMLAKKTYCENRDNILSFPCPVKTEAWEGENYFKDSLDLDHIDGNHDNNIPENIRTLCKLCHTYNSRLEKQWDSNKESGRDIEG